jgi:hypothetical protein
MVKSDTVDGALLTFAGQEQALVLLSGRLAPIPSAGRVNGLPLLLFACRLSGGSVLDQLLAATAGWNSR